MLPLLDTPASAVQQRRGILELTTAELNDWLKQHGHTAMRARQIRRWILVVGAETFEQMTDLPKELRQQLADAFVPFTTSVDQHKQAADNTHKLLLKLSDGRRVECVLIQEGPRRTACISTQVGCGMGCVFCASGIDGVERNLTTAEIVEQLLRLRNLPAPGANPAEAGSGAMNPEAVRLSHVVVMGMGEPLANFDALMDALEVATAPDCLGIGARHITISTVGLPVKIRRLADLGKQHHLAVSLHAPNDALRSQIVATNPKTGLAAILEAADYYYQKTGRQVTFEYVMLRDLNDDATHARELALLLRGRKAHINVIPFNDVEGLPYKRPTQDSLTAFTEVLTRHGVSVKVRKRKGSEIDAACGQLRRRVEIKEPQRHRDTEGKMEKEEEKL